MNNISEIGSKLFRYAIDNPWTCLSAFAVASGAGAHIGARALNAVPVGRWLSFLEGIGRAVSAAGNRWRITKAFWEPLEKCFLNVLRASVDAFARGMTADNGKGGHAGGVTAPPTEG